MTSPVSSAPVPRVLTIAGSDSGAGAGVQADLKTFAALGVYGLSAVTAVTAQNTLGVRAVMALPVDLVEAQINVVLEDIGADILKTGMLPNAAIIEAVAECIRASGLRVVVDPVMQAKDGAALLEPAALASLRTTLLPLAEVITPNLPEAAALLGRSIGTLAEMHAAVRALHALGPRHVVLKGGHCVAEPTDVYFDGEHCFELSSQRIQTRHTHGTGCTFAAALAALLARGCPVESAVVEAKTYVTGAIRHAPGLGHGHGPLEHFWRYRQWTARQQDEGGEPVNG
jgi:hydroxymethylpyrimidine/phosphomethylpyrimidine kinase